MRGSMEDIRDMLRGYPPEEFAQLGVGALIYVRKAEECGLTVYRCCAADGGLLATIAGLETAFAAIRQHDLEPVSVH